MTQYQSYLKKLEEQNSQEDKATFSVVDLKLDEEHFMSFQNELNELMNKYYHIQNKGTEKETLFEPSLLQLFQKRELTQYT